MSTIDELPWSNRKRLIVCCDGTWENATGDTFQPPTNVTRLSRAISRAGLTVESGINKRISQIVYYQKGVGTGLLGDKLGGGAIGLGLSSNVRAAYGFLVDNFDDGDEIFFFGFSRGAYTARAVAGLVTNLGLLTSRGMDNFATVYNDYYQRDQPASRSRNKDKSHDTEWRRRVGFRENPLSPFTVKIIGVWDTVGFHDTWLGRWVGEKLELPNTMLPADVEYAFQALSLDETRNAYQPILWDCAQGGNNNQQELRQVWFSGYHSDVGGGASNPRLADIALAWMVSQCTKNNQLSIDLEYFYDDDDSAKAQSTTAWDTRLGDANPPGWSIVRILESLKGRSARKPLGYSPAGRGLDTTHESVHESVRERNLFARGEPGYWPLSGVFTGPFSNTGWHLRNGYNIPEFRASSMETHLRGKIRKVHPDRLD
ncbi:hypothetical protein FE257_006077 [Aspergillus nanangensis]|uniref:T6SS Phospholipase effector Tle1-like catalytic domain-containing protein n=1 Tax=Aspergillus nanangensis TaxID=2582783 RepID=A0AAD4CPR6_ASPNN|nr:hypothetical protein FE257_006077 [Aspergillus nanangensis]